MTNQPVAEDDAAHRRQQLKVYTREIEALCGDSPAARVKLRRGLRRSLDDVRQMHRWVASSLPARRSEAQERAYYAVAAMIAAQPRYTFASDSGSDQEKVPSDAAEGPGANSNSPHDGDSSADRYGPSLGLAFAHAVEQSYGGEREMRASTAERRLDLLTRQSLDGLHRHLPSSVRYLRRLEVEIDWAQLLADLADWPNYSGRIARRWLQDYYRQRYKAAHEAAAQEDDADEGSVQPE